MKLVVDANIPVRLVVGRRAPIDFCNARGRGIAFFTTYRQIEESRGVLVRTFALSDEDAVNELLEVSRPIALIEDDVIAPYEDHARVRLHLKGQPDWPVLAAAIATRSGVWTDDRDFFGVGVPIWSSDTICHAEPASEDHNA